MVQKKNKKQVHQALDSIFTIDYVAEIANNCESLLGHPLECLF